MRFAMDDYMRLNDDSRKAIEGWANQYVEANRCFGFELVADGPAVAVRFWIYDRDKYEYGMAEVPWHNEERLNVDHPPTLYDRWEAVTP